MAQLPTVEAIRNELTANLVVTVVVSHKTGSYINIGETFKISIKVYNDLLYVDAAFSDVWLFVEGTDFATPTAPTSGTQVNISLGNIPCRTSKTAIVELKAVKRFSFADIPLPVADIRVRAQFAIQQLFNNFWQNQTFCTKIEAS